MARASTDDKLAALEELPADSAARSERLAAALADRHYRVVAKAARRVGEALLYDLVPALRDAYGRFLDNAVKSDPNCIAKKALVHALVALDCDDVDFYAAALRYRQLEPVWGGKADTAIDVRSNAAMGLVATGYSRALVLLAESLHDPEAPVRIAAARAIACGNPREAELLLRSKALAGDTEPAVLGECFTALLSVEPEESLPFIVRHLEGTDETLKQLAALALGESRAESALPPLRAAWNEPVVAEETRRVLIRAAAAHRSDSAFEWLLEIAGEARVPLAMEVIAALAIYKQSDTRAQRLKAVLMERGEASLAERFASLSKSP
jgi:HEAT repeat protein